MKRYKRRRKKENRLEGLSVKVYDNNVEKALRKLKKMVKESKLLVELKERQYYIKKSEKKRKRAEVVLRCVAKDSNPSYLKKLVDEYFVDKEIK